jgi:hypothetical protein
MGDVVRPTYSFYSNPPVQSYAGYRFAVGGN